MGVEGNGAFERMPREGEGREEVGGGGGIGGGGEKGEGEGDPVPHFVVFVLVWVGGWAEEKEFDE